MLIHEFDCTVEDDGNPKDGTLLEIDGRPDRPADSARLLQYLSTASWREEIKNVRLKYRSQLTDLAFLECLPAVEHLSSDANSLTTLFGLATAKRLWGLKLQPSARKNRTQLDELLHSPLIDFWIEYAREQDIAVVNQSRSIKRLRLKSSALTRFGQLESLPLEDLTIILAPLRWITDLDTAAGFDRLTLAYCRNLEGFSSRTSRLQKLDLESCSRFDIATLTHAPNLEYLAIRGCKRTFALSALASLHALRDLTISVSGIEKTDPLLPNGTFPALRRLWISPAKGDWLQKISAQLPRVRVCAGETLYIDGVAQPDMQAFYAPLVTQ